MATGKRALVAQLVLLSVTAFVLIGYGTSKISAPLGAEKQRGKTYAEKVITYNLGAIPQTLEPALHSSRPEATLLMALMEGLYRYGPDRKLQPAVAEKVDISADGKRYAFTLRTGIRWTNGDPVTADDFEYAWKYLLNKDTMAENAFLAYYLKNGEKFNNGAVSASQVGVKAKGENTLEVELEVPAPFFLDLTALPNFFPVNKKLAEISKNWHANPGTFVGNGPFRMVKWEAQQKIHLEKNYLYWDAANVKLDRLIVALAASEDAGLTMFRANQADVAETIPAAEIPQLLTDGTAIALPEAGTYYYLFNTKERPFNDRKVRQAFTLSIDRKNIVETVTMAGEKPALGFVPYGMPDVTPGKDFRTAGGNYFKDRDVNAAKRLLAEAGYPGGRGLPEIDLVYNTSQNHQRIAEAVARMWEDNLGARVKTRNMEWNDYVDTREAGDFMVARSGWIPDYNDPMSFFEIFAAGTDNGTFWNNSRYNQLIKGANNTNNQQNRMRVLHEAEKILMEEMPVLPVYFYANVNAYRPWVKNVFVPPFGGEQEFKWADVDTYK